MASENRPLSKEQAPDPARVYGREKPEAESGMGRLDVDEVRPSDQPDRAEAAVKNKQDPTRQLNAQDVIDQRASRAATGQPDHSMSEDDQIDTDTIPEESSNPRIGGKGGTPDAGKSRRRG